MYSDKDIDRILDVADIYDVAKEFLTLKPAKANYVCCCPVHNERTPSFTITPSKNMFHCFGCGISGNVISFLTKVQGMTFPEAIKWLSNRYGIVVEEDKPESEQDRQERIKLDIMRAAIANAMSFYYDNLFNNADKVAAVKGVRDYIDKRWGLDFAQSESIGYAPAAWDALYKWAKEKGHPIDIFIELGLLVRKGDRIFDFFRNRVMIPIKDRTGRPIAFTARALDDDGPKYLNSKESQLYKKGESIFGIQNALRQAAKEELFYLVEGAPDVMRLHSLRVYNTVASLGTAWTQEQRNQLRRVNARLCFIPDSDKIKQGEQYGAGIAAVMKNGLAAMLDGFNVTVKEIPGDAGEKNDPDSFITTRTILNELEEQDFIVWYTRKLADGKDTAIEKTEIIKTIAGILAKVPDKIKNDFYIKQLIKILGGTQNLWKTAINEAVRKNVENSAKSGSRLLDQELYQKYGFYERHHCYYSMDDKGQDKEWSNFIMVPLFHIKDDLNPKRLYKLINNEGENCIVEMKMEDLCSVLKFKIKVGGKGNFVWAAKDEQLTKLQRFLFGTTESATEIKQLGWNYDGFFAFGNGAFYQGIWYPVDEYGIVRLPGLGNYYLPGASTIYKQSRELFQFERRFIHTNYSTISLRSYTDKLIGVFGNNAKVGICFLLATLFKDVVTSVTKNFPILNMFGPKGSGKSELGHSLMSFFIIRNEPPNLSTSTDAGLADAVAQCSNALVHIDEYKNTIELNRREFLKGLYDGVGRTRMNMDRDKKRETTAVDCGIMLSGQEMPTIDIALYSRLVFLTFNTSEFTAEAKRKFDDLKDVRDLGCSHLTVELLKHRAKFEAEFASNYRSTLSDVVTQLANMTVEDRILRNWVIPLAAFRSLSGVIDVSFDYKEMLAVSIKGILRQNEECLSNNEISNFWSSVDFLHQNGEIFIDADYRIKYDLKIKTKEMKEAMQFRERRPILYMCTKRIFKLYQKNAKMTGETVMSEASLRYYLTISKEFLGTKNAVRFANLVNPKDNVTVTDNNGKPVLEKTQRTDWALCFDYQSLAEKYGINLEVEVWDDIDPDDIDTSDKELPY